MFNFDSPWYEGNDITYVGTDDNGTQHWHCETCDGFIVLTRLKLTLSSHGMYSHWKPGREPVTVPQAFYTAFKESDL